MNIEKVFFFFFKIKKFQHHLQKADKNVIYSILKTEKFFFFRRFTVLFYNLEAVEKTIENVLFDIIQTEYEIQIQKLRILFKNREQIVVEITSNKHALLTGKFRQNKKTFENFLARVLFLKYHFKYQLECKMEKIQPAFRAKKDDQIQN